MYNLAHDIKAYLRFTNKELIQFFITVIFTAFFLSFRYWGVDTFNLTEGLTNLLLSFLFILIFLFLHVAAQKATALWIGYTATYQYSLIGLLIGMFFVFFTNGIPLLLIGTFWLTHSERLRLGKFRYGLNYSDVAKVAFAGPLVNVLLIIVLKPIYFATGSDFVFRLIVFNALIACFSLLPVPHNTGLNLFMKTRSIWILAFIFTVLYSLITVLGGPFAFIISAVVAIAVTVLFLRNVEHV
jgi:hypothetical protein